MLIVTYNIQWGKGKDERVDLDRIARTVASADIIALQEVERHWRPMEHADQVARLASLLPEHHYVFGISVDVDGSRTSESGRVEHLRRQYGNLVLSRWPIASTRTFPLRKYPVHGHIIDRSMAIEANVSHPAHPFRVYSTHLNFLSRRQRLIQVGELIEIINDAPRQGGPAVGVGVEDGQFGEDWMALPREAFPPVPVPAIVLGDFNMHVGSPEYDGLVGPIDPCYGRLHEGGLLADALTVAGMPEDEGWTHPGEDAYGPKRIDHCFVTIDLVDRVRRGWIDYDADGSDHQPVWVELDIG